MFDIGFIELILISVVSLLVLGPERLPGAIRTLGLWIGRLRRSFNNIKRDIEKEVGADEIRRQLRNEEIMARFKDTKSQFTETVDSVKKEAAAIKKEVSMEDQLAAFTGQKPASSESTTAATAPSSESETIAKPSATKEPSPSKEPSTTADLFSSEEPSATESSSSDPDSTDASSEASKKAEQ